MLTFLQSIIIPFRAPKGSGFTETNRLNLCLIPYDFLFHFFIYPFTHFLLMLTFPRALLSPSGSFAKKTLAILFAEHR